MDPIISLDHAAPTPTAQDEDRRGPRVSGALLVALGICLIAATASVSIMLTTSGNALLEPAGQDTLQRCLLDLAADEMTPVEAEVCAAVLLDGHAFDGAGAAVPGPWALIGIPVAFLVGLGTNRRMVGDLRRSDAG